MPDFFFSPGNRHNTLVSVCIYSIYVWKARPLLHVCASSHMPSLHSIWQAACAPLSALWLLSWLWLLCRRAPRLLSEPRLNLRLSNGSPFSPDASSHFILSSPTTSMFVILFWVGFFYSMHQALYLIKSRVFDISFRHLKPSHRDTQTAFLPSCFKRNQSLFIQIWPWQSQT